MLMNFSELLKNELFAAFVCFMILGLAAVISWTAWAFLFSIILSFVLGDVFLNFFIHGGEGWTKIFTDAQFTSKGSAFFVFMIGIVVGTLLSAFITDWIFQYVQSQLTWEWAIVLTDLSVVVAVFSDLEWRFYNR